MCVLFGGYPNRAAFTVVRGPVPRHASIVTVNVHASGAADVFRFGGELAGDRPPRYVTSDVFRLDRTFAGDRPPRYEKRSGFLSGLKCL